MPEDEGVLGSTTEDSQDVALLEAEENVSQPESKLPEPEVHEPDEAENLPDEEEGEGAEEGKETDKPFPYDRPSMQQLREAFPDIFKKFPSLRDIYYREQEFSQIFSTLEEAKEASTNAASFNDLSGKILKGDSSSFLNAIKTADEKAFESVATDFLPALFKISPDTHWKATLPILQNLVRGFYIEGKKRNNENVMNSAEYLSDFLFGDIAVAKGEKNLVPQKVEQSEEAKQLAKDRAEFEQKKHMDFFSSVKSSVDDQMKGIIDVNKIDPDDVFSDFIKETIVGKILSEVDKQLVADKAHMKYMQSLWDKAQKDGYSDNWKSRILSAYLARAKSLVPAIRAKLVAEARGSSSRVSAKTKAIAEKNNARREPGAGGRASREGSNGAVDARKVNWDKTSDMDLLNDNITYK